MSARWLVDLVAIIAGSVAILTYCGVQPNALDKVPDSYKKEAENAVKAANLEIDSSNYLKEGNAAFLMLQAALVMDSGYSRDQALTKSIQKALDLNDYKIALMAAKNIDSNYTKDTQLIRIASIAISDDKKSLGYAIVAADLANASYNKDKIVKMVIGLLSGEVPNVGVPITPAHEVAVDPKLLSDLEKYKLMFQFANSRFGMDLSETDAKQFVDNWLSSKTFEEFMFFEQVYSVANSSIQLNMDNNEAKEFTLKWIEKGYLKENLDFFTDAYLFAYRGSGMDMSQDDAMKFAYEKLEEHLNNPQNKPNHANNTELQNGQ